MISALCSRLLILAISVAFVAVTLSGQNLPKKTPPQKAPAKAETLAGLDDIEHGADDQIREVHTA